jgi:hypothetical protein
MTNNLVMLDNSTFLVRTQAGFKKAICLYAKVKNYKEFKEEYRYIENYPKAYPSVVTFSTYYKGYYQICCTCTKVNKYLDKLNKVIEIIKIYDKK